MVSAFVHDQFCAGALQCHDGGGREREYKKLRNGMQHGVCCLVWGTGGGAHMGEHGRTSRQDLPRSPEQSCCARWNVTA